MNGSRHMYKALQQHTCTACGAVIQIGHLYIGVKPRRSDMRYTEQLCWSCAKNEITQKLQARKRRDAAEQRR